MSKHINAFDVLAESLEVLPNVGPKTARRMAYYLLQENNRAGASHLLNALDHALKHIQYCQLCNTLCEEDLCSLCQDEKRDHSRLMVVQLPLDISVVESANCYDGLYFVLMGALQPIKGMDLDSIAVKKLVERLKRTEVEEIIIATSFTPEGEATAYVLTELFKNLPYRVTRLARGIPLGSELEYIDLATLSQSFYERNTL